MNFSQGHSGTKVRDVSFVLVFLRKNTRIFRKMGEIHEHFVLALSLVWFAGATPDERNSRFVGESQKFGRGEEAPPPHSRLFSEPIFGKGMRRSTFQ